MPVPTTCPRCGSPIKLVPAGISKKTGKPYNQFYACSNIKCDYVYRPSRERAKPNQEYDQGEAIIQGLREIYKVLKEISFKLDGGHTIHLDDSNNTGRQI